MEELVNKICEDIQICDEGPWMLPETTLKPSGKEKGEVLIIGVGGSTLRLTRVTISHPLNTSEELLSESIPDDAKKEDLFGWIASRIVPALDAFTSTQPSPPSSSSSSSPCTIGVSWSFPISKGKVSVMGKLFSSKYVGQDLIQLFNEAFPERYRISSATHDGTSSLLAGMHGSPQCKMALTLGTGVNLNVESANGVIVNTEISMLGRNDTSPHIELSTEKWDIEGPMTEFQPLESKVGGLYLGQMATNALGEHTSTLDIWKVLANLEDFRFDVLNAIVNRAAWLVAAVIYGLALKLGNVTPHQGGEVEVVYTGGVIFEPEFRRRLVSRLDELNQSYGFSIKLIPEKYGSEVGAAIAALAAQNCS